MSEIPYTVPDPDDLGEFRPELTAMYYLRPDQLPSLRAKIVAINHSGYSRQLDQHVATKSIAQTPMVETWSEPEPMTLEWALDSLDETYHQCEEQKNLAEGLFERHDQDWMDANRFARALVEILEVEIVELRRFPSPIRARQIYDLLDKSPVVSAHQLHRYVRIALVRLRALANEIEIAPKEPEESYDKVEEWDGDDDEDTGGDVAVDDRP